MGATTSKSAYSTRQTPTVCEVRVGAHLERLLQIAQAVVHGLYLAHERKICRFCADLHRYVPGQLAPPAMYARVPLS
jgi:hypothetical protein